jgi:hypothetical protein
VRKHTFLQLHLPGTKRAGLEKILATTNLDELRKLTNTYGKSSAYNLGRVDWNGKGRTVDFRQHAGTLDPDAVLHWIAFVTKLVEIALNDDIGTLVWHFVELERLGERFGIFQLMRRFLDVLRLLIIMSDE